MEVKVEVLNFRVTDKPGNVIPKSITIEDIEIKIAFGEKIVIKVDKLNGEYSPEFTLFPFLLDPESVVKLVDTADYQGVDLLEAGEFWHKVDDAVAEVLEQARILIK